MLEWEPIVEPMNYEFTERMAVFGGWLVRSGVTTKKEYVMCFVPDANHEWEL